MPSGRCTASTLITSAPIAASHAVANGPGPERGEVEHLHARERPLARRRPASATRRRTRAATASRRPRAGATSSRSGTPWKRNGARGRIHDSPGCCTNTSRADAAWSKRGQLGAVADDRRRHARRRRTRRRPRRRRARVVQPCSDARSLRRRAGTGRSSCRARRRSPMSSRPIDLRERLPLRGGDGRDADVAAVAGRLVAGDHHPAEARHAARRGSAPSASARSTNVICIASSIDTSTVSGTPVRDARHHAVAAPSAANAPVTYSPSCPPTVSGGRSVCPWFDRLPLRGLQHLFGAVEAVVGPAVPDGGDRDRDERSRAVRRACRARRRSRCRPPRATASASAAWRCDVRR